MAGKEKSFEELVKEAPAAPAAGTVSLIGTLARSGEAGKFVLTLQDGSTVTLETAAVEGHEVLGTSVGQTIVRVDVEAEKIPPTSPTRVPDIIKAHNDPGQTHQGEDRALPFALATPHQVSPSTLEAMRVGGGGGFVFNPFSVFWADVKHPIVDQKQPPFDHETGPFGRFTD